MNFANFKLSRIAGNVICFIAALLMASCSEPQIGDKQYFFMNFGDGDNGDGDLYREIPAEGGSITLLSPKENPHKREHTQCYLINQPLSWFEANRDEYTRYDWASKYNYYYRGDMLSIFGNGKPDEVELYRFSDGYEKPDINDRKGFQDVPLLYDVNKFHYGTADWLQIRIYADKIEVEAAPNDSGHDRYISFIYDIFGNPKSYYGSIEVKQPALK